MLLFREFFFAAGDLISVDEGHRLQFRTTLLTLILISPVVLVVGSDQQPIRICFLKIADFVVGCDVLLVELEAIGAETVLIEIELVERQALISFFQFELVFFLLGVNNLQP